MTVRRFKLFSLPVVWVTILIRRSLYLMHVHLSSRFFFFPQHSNTRDCMQITTSNPPTVCLPAHSWLQEEWEAENGNCNQERERRRDLPTLLCEKICFPPLIKVIRGTVCANQAVAITSLQRTVNIQFPPIRQYYDSQIELAHS